MTKPTSTPFSGGSKSLSKGMVSRRPLVIFGGTSEIGLAIAKRLLTEQPVPVIVAARRTSSKLDSALQYLRDAGAEDVTVVDFDASDVVSHPRVVGSIFQQPVGRAVVAFGVLGDAERAWKEQPEAVDIATVDYTAAVSVGVLVAQHMSEQGFGQIIALSSVAGEQVRPSNFVYGSAKAGMDAFYSNLGMVVESSGVHVLVVRPGQVRTAMVAEAKKVPLSVSADRVAEVTVKALDERKHMVRVPAVFGPILAIMSLLPRSVRKALPY